MTEEVYIVKCSGKCKKWQSCIVKKILDYTFLCRRCGYRRKLKDKRHYGLSLETMKTNTQRAGIQMCMQMNMKVEHEKKGFSKDGFSPRRVTKRN